MLIECRQMRAPRTWGIGVFVLPRRSGAGDVRQQRTGRARKLMETGSSPSSNRRLQLLAYARGELPQMERECRGRNAG